MKKKLTALLMATLTYLLSLLFLNILTSPTTLASELSNPFFPKVVASIEKYGRSWKIVDLDKLAYCVGWHETKMCSSQGSPTANAKNNCYGIMTWQRGYRELKYYPTKEDSTKDFIRIWKRGYGGRIPTESDAIIYTGNDRARHWYLNVTSCYNNFNPKS